MNPILETGEVCTGAYACGMEQGEGRGADGEHAKAEQRKHIGRWWGSSEAFSSAKSLKASSRS